VGKLLEMKTEPYVGKLDATLNWYSIVRSSLYYAKSAAGDGGGGACQPNQVAR
jgi:hypothetical protein